MSSRLTCKDKVDKFCYVCCHYEIAKFRRLISEDIRSKYKKCFGISINNLDKPWVPKNIWNSCKILLHRWNKRDNITKTVIEPVMWREPTNHENDYYFYVCNIIGFNLRNKNKIVYPNVSSVTPAKIDKKITQNIPELSCLTTEDENLIDINITDVNDNESDSDSENSTHLKDPVLYNQENLYDLIRDLDLTKDLTELLGSRLKERNLLIPGTTISCYRHIEKQFLKYFTMHESLVYCNNVEGLVNEFKCEIYEPSQ